MNEIFQKVCLGVRRRRSYHGRFVDNKNSVCERIVGNCAERVSRRRIWRAVYAPVYGRCRVAREGSEHFRGTPGGSEKHNRHATFFQGAHKRTGDRGFSCAGIACEEKHRVAGTVKRAETRQSRNELYLLGVWLIRQVQIYSFGKFTAVHNTKITK